MKVIGLSLLFGIVGVFLTRASVNRLARGESPPDAHGCWALGLVSLVPSWLIASFGLLGTTPGLRPQYVGAAAWILSGAAGLAGAIFTERRVRETETPGGPMQSWRLGLLGFAVAWGIAVVAHLVRFAWT